MRKPQWLSRGAKGERREREQDTDAQEDKVMVELAAVTSELAEAVKRIRDTVNGEDDG